MVMANNDNLAAYGRQLTDPSYKTTPFKPQNAPSNVDDRRFGLFGQQWSWDATQADDRVLWDADTFYITCEDTDQVYPGDTTDNKARTELVRKPRVDNDTLIWVAFKFRIKTDVVPFGPEGFKYILLHQIHQTPKITNVVPGQPPISLRLNQSAYTLDIYHYRQDPGDLDEEIERVLSQTPYVVNQWHTYVAKCQFSGGDTDGTFKAWIDGSVVYDSASDGSWTGHLGYDHNSQLGAKIGVYMQKDSAPIVEVDYRNPEIQAHHGLLHPDYAGYS